MRQIKKSCAYSNRSHLVMNTSTQIAQLPGSLNRLMPNQASPCFVSGMGAAIDSIIQELSINASNRKSHALIVTRSI